MSFSFRNLFSQDSEGDAQPPPGTPANPLPGDAAGPIAEPIQPGVFGNNASPASGDPASSSPQVPFSPTPQPTDRGNFEAMFAGQGAPEPGPRQTFALHEIKPFIPPALAAIGEIPLDRTVSIEMPADGSADVKLSVIYAACPDLFATEITPLNDSVVTLPLPGGADAPAAANPFSSALMAQAQDSLAATREPGETLDFRTESPSFAANAPFGDSAAAPSLGGEPASDAETAFQPPPSFSLPESGTPAAAPTANNPFDAFPASGPPETEEVESVPAEVLPAESLPAEPQSAIEDPGDGTASAFGFPPPRDGDPDDGGDAASPFGAFGSPPVPAGDSADGNPDGAAAQGFGFPPGEPSAMPADPVTPPPPAEGIDPAGPEPFEPPREPNAAPTEIPAPTQAPATPPFEPSAVAGELPAENPFESGPHPDPSANPFAAAAPPENQTAGSGPDPASAANPFASLPPLGGLAAEGAAAPGETPPGPPAAATPVSENGERKVTFHLRNLLGGAPEAGIDPMQVPAEAMIELPIALVESQLATGSVTLPLGELAKHADPAAGPILQSGNAQAPVTLPDNDLFHQISDLAPMPPPRENEAPAPAEVGRTELEEPRSPAGQSRFATGFESPPGGESPFATPFSEQAHQDEGVAGSPLPPAGFPGTAAGGSLGETESDLPPGPGSATAPAAGLENPFEGPTDPPAVESPSPGQPVSPANPFAPLERATDQSVVPSEETPRPPAEDIAPPPGEVPAAHRFLDSPDRVVQMPADDSPASVPLGSPAPPAGGAAAPNGGGNTSETQLPSFDALAPQPDPGTGSSFLDELEAETPAETQPQPQPQPGIGTPTGPLETPAPAAHQSPVDDAVVADVELRAVFGVSDRFDAQKVADLSSQLPGVAACVITGPQGVFQGRTDAEPGFAQKAETLFRSAREFAEATGVPHAESFTIHTDQGAISIFVSGEDRCLAVRHEPGGFDPGVREKLILVARGLAGLN